MAISLEVKKFVNTEYVGKFAEIELPIAQPEDEEPPRKARKKPDKKDKKEKKASFIRKRADYDGDDDDYDDIDSEIEAGAGRGGRGGAQKVPQGRPVRQKARRRS